MDKSNSQDKGSSAITLTKEQEKTILDQANNSICLIIHKYHEYKGFFCLIPDSDFASLQPVLITVYLNFSSVWKNEPKTLKLVYNNQEKIIEIDESRHAYSNKSYNITIIELKENEFPQEIFLILDDLINNTGQEEVLNTQYINQDIYLIHHNKDNNSEFSYDKIKEIKSFLIKDYCPNETILEGAPILNLNNFNVIGIHIGKSHKTNVNIGGVIRVPIIEYNKSKEDSKKQNATGLLNIVKKEDEPNSIIELISQKYSEDKNYLLKKLSEHLILAELTDDYKMEVENKFQTNITKVFDTKTDTNTLLNVLSKVKGLPNLIVYISIGDENCEKPDENQLFYINGKIDIVDNTFTFENSDVYGYGNYLLGNSEEYDYVFFRPQNTQIYIKIKLDCIYVMCYRKGVEIKFMLKIMQNFMDNPIVVVSRTKIDLDDVKDIGDATDEGEEDYEMSDFEKIMKFKENIDAIFEKKTKVYYLDIKELIIYKIDG